MSDLSAARGTSARHRWLGLLVAVTIVSGCGPSIVSTATYQPGQTGGAGTVEPSAPVTSDAPSVEPSLPPSDAPTAAPTNAPVVPPHLNPGFQYMDLLKVRVNKLAVRKQPVRSADLLHAYDIFHEPSPADLGAVRLNTGDFVSMHLGPVPVGDTVWYLVWGAEDGSFHESDWYAEPPFDGSLGPGWVAANVAGKDYLTLDRHATMEEIDSFLPLGVNAAGFGSWQSDPQPRHDGFLLDWAAAAPTQGTACKLTIQMVPEDPAAEPFVARSTITTTTVKVSTITGKVVDAPWLPAPDGSWDEFRLVVDSTCNWAVRLTPLHHD